MSDAKISRPFAYRLRDGPPCAMLKKSYFILSPVGHLDVHLLGIGLSLSARYISLESLSSLGIRAFVC